MKLDWIIESSIDELQREMQDGKLTSRMLTLFYLDRIAKQDKAGARINSVLEVNPDALFLAEAMDAERVLKGPRGPLHGIPVLIKDNIDTGDKMHTSAGSLALANSYAAQDAFLVKQLRKAGAVILGKTNLTEFANFMTENMPNGYSSRGGQVLNPYGPGRFDVSGSSSGSGASIAANFAAVAVGTETDGSILSPSNANSLVGIKPTVGLISRSGIIPISHSQDTAGPMARSVRDAAILLGVLTGVDENDPSTYRSVGRASANYTSYLDRNGLRGARIGIARTGYFEKLTDDKLAIVNQAIADLAAAGAEIIDPVTVSTEKERWVSDVLIYEFKSALNAYLGKLPAHTTIRSLQDVIAFNKQHAEQALRYGQTLLEASQEVSGTLTDPVYLESRARDLLLSQTEGIDKVMREHRLDAVLFPGSYGSSITARGGYPAIVVPAGYTAEGQPFGITFAGSAWTEPTLLRLAYAYEQSTNHRVPPVIIESLSSVNSAL